MSASKTIHIQYFAVFRERRGENTESLNTTAATPQDLYSELSTRFGFTLPSDRVRVIINESFSDWSTPLTDGDHIVFIPPVAGG